MAVPMIYNSCMTDEALDTAIADWSEVSKKVEAQDAKKAEWDEEQAQIKEQKEGAGETYVYQEGEWEDLKPEAYTTTEQKFVICIDTLGQDRELTDEQKRFVLESAQNFKDTWTKFEQDKLTIDRDQRMLINTTDKEWIADNIDRIKDEEEKFVDDKILEIEDQIVDDDHRTLCGNKFHLEYQALIFKEREEFQTRFSDLKNYKVVKYGKFIQALLYFLGYDKEKITEPGTQKFFWKTAKSLMDDAFLTKMEEYDFRGSKDSVFKPYQTLNFIEKNMAGIVAEDVDEFNMVAGRMFRWLQLALENRKNDIVRRKSLIHKQREERDNLIKSKDERDAKRIADLEENKTKFLEENKDEIDAFE